MTVDARVLLGGEVEALDRIWDRLGAARTFVGRDDDLVASMDQLADVTGRLAAPIGRASARSAA
ncbi:hypothetical protein [Caulobacter radicis]|uniref:Uncharacterized protein n=1 Tax=Caulobacter radicis TaxID=2172650 RepID=A0A2T9JM92_9CAUL|nr:hypothetical protein [Caulobacter radicis]PVM84784.1 hypothetical protein DDF65_08055 [Caulobacter radicis]